MQLLSSSCFRKILSPYCKIIIAVCALWAVSCLNAETVREQADRVFYRQPDGQEIPLSKLPQRVIIGYGSLAKVWDLAGGRAIGVPALAEKNALPAAMRDRPPVGSATAPNLERVLALEPDLVLLIAKLEKHRATAEMLRRAGVEAVCVNYNNYRDFHQLLDFFCRLNGRTLESVPAARKVTQEVEAICAKVRHLQGPRCAILFASSMGFALESSRTNTGTMVEMLGGRNIFTATEGPLRGKFSYEQLLMDNPDVIFIIPMGNAKGLQKKFQRDFAEQPAWKELDAAKNNCVHFLPIQHYLYMPGPDYPEAFRHLARLLYPEMEQQP